MVKNIALLNAKLKLYKIGTFGIIMVCYSFIAPVRLLI